jgi:hypothetical protein
LQEGAILDRKCGRPTRFVARLRQQVAKLNHLPRGQLIDVDPDCSATFNLSRQSYSFGHQLYHTSLVDGRTSSSDVAIDEDMFVCQRHPTHEPIAELYIIEDNLRKKARRACSPRCGFS